MTTNILDSGSERIFVSYYHSLGTTMIRNELMFRYAWRKVVIQYILCDDSW
jgi:hypothetical protein